MGDIYFCPYPDCDGILQGVKDGYGSDADGRRGVTIYYAWCFTCDRDPDDYKEADWAEWLIHNRRVGYG